MTTFQLTVKARIVDLASDILRDRVNLVEGCRKLVQLHAQLDDKDDELFLPIIALESETDHLPVGETRAFWCPEALAKKEKAVEPYLDAMRDEVKAVCRLLVAKYTGPAATNGEEEGNPGR